MRRMVVLRVTSLVELGVVATETCYLELLRGFLVENSSICSSLVVGSDQ